MTDRFACSSSKARWRRVGWVAALVLLFAGGVGIRRAVLSAQVRALGMHPPFTLESALQYRLVRHLYDTGRIPRHDPMVEIPEGIDVPRTYTLGAEYAYAAMARAMPARLELSERIRWASVLWFCLGIPLTALWAGWLTRSRGAGLWAGAFYAAALASVIRSTGQELSHENFALPLFIGHLAATAWMERRTRRTFWTPAPAALLLGAALMTWDLIQFAVWLWALTGLVDGIRGKMAREPWRRQAWGWHFFVLALCGAVNPYLRSHGFLLSPVMLLACGVSLATLPSTRLGGPGWRAAAVRGAVALLPPALMLAWPDGFPYLDHYGHFGELFAAKLRFLNRKPADPALLTFHQRILWTPALHSTTPSMALGIFPALLGLTIPAWGVLCLQRSDIRRRRFFPLYLGFGVSLALFVLFFRFHVFLVLYAAGTAACAWKRAADTGGWTLRIAGFLLGAGLLIETAHGLDRPERWGRPGVYYQEQIELTDWLQAHVAPEGVLANFGISASILTYGGCPIVLHPKFEHPGIRERVREYGEALFLGNEETFRDWAEPFGVRHVVFARGEFASGAVEYQMRYMVHAVDPPPEAAARLFEYRPESGRWSHLLWENRKYRVFLLVTRAAQARAEEALRRAEEALRHHRLDEAERKAQEALAEDPRAYDALRILGHVDALRTHGPGVRPARGDPAP